MDKDVLSTNDWIKISIKFSGLCLNCKKKLDSGEYGYWSKLSKSVLHQSCYDSLFLPQRLPSPSSSPSPSQSSLDPKGVSSDSAAAADAARVSGENNGKPATTTTTTHPPPPPPAAALVLTITPMKMAITFLKKGTRK